MNRFIPEQTQFSRRSFIELGGAAILSVTAAATSSAGTDPTLEEAIARLEYLTPVERAFILDKGKAGVSKLPPEKLREIGLTPETWSLGVFPDPSSNSIVGKSLSRTGYNALHLVTVASVS